jgi:hypothetical protein
LGRARAWRHRWKLGVTGITSGREGITESGVRIWLGSAPEADMDAVFLALLISLGVVFLVTWVRVEWFGG